ncbi:hypothetical protein GCM10025857_38490 [Alicyclobacillus contaminans]|uniref:DUF1450 domain-containing protein n=1 Tax=Alicyclobacillus contaminans TaxID=392016 RepID=UPI00040622C6|nr:DUF1450 domain-containing protein [Alicyclobacillus contaminans]GMA52492.1 hypothetical protein GCM10025857_38490 [Alicyclobacillus contaminans]
MSVPSAMKITWCAKNLKAHSQAVFDALQSTCPEADMQVEECVDYCGLCTDVPFALRNQAVIAARDPRGLYRKLEQGTSFLTKPALPGTYAAVVGGRDEQVQSQDAKGPSAKESTS